MSLFFLWLGKENKDVPPWFAPYVNMYTSRYLTLFRSSFRNSFLAGEMAQRLTAGAALPEVLSSVPINHMVTHNHL
ncbi:solute carrier family 37 (glycerol-3-phosphate transporter), member 3 [Cricetulus griseus]|uniref:Solute carrier family 37 (Glycerol-3-phosphate transporter), member 3 n=1 Tax=Cricetulus griseus TaxID=10029 RepID=A0A061I1S7_CRIGR|nr:solute carrier family 37 (glycerol-3-phosphate transporter), member 3 [Cricetulus griseus]